MVVLRTACLFLLWRKCRVFNPPNVMKQGVHQVGCSTCGGGKNEWRAQNTCSNFIKDNFKVM